ncbi:MAG: hypothetical protein HWN65_21335 [Candidatus Helarchaeota archaeon]|nr:hypothetical protein [Candidatus Helarchaeota archaeon]
MDGCKAEEPPIMGVKAVSIVMSGKPMVTVKIEEDCDESLMEPFLAAIGSFSKEVLGGAQDIFFQSNDHDLCCLFKNYSTFELSIFALMDAKMEKKKRASLHRLRTVFY